MSDNEGNRQRHSTGLRTAYWLVLVISGCFLVRGCFYATLFPVWEGYDEWSHFAFIQHLLAHGELPRGNQTRVSREVQESLKLVPLPWMLRDFPAPHLTHDDYWKLSAEERLRRQQELVSLPRQWAREQATEQILLYEAQQPPLYYWLHSWPMRTTAETSLPSRVLLLRYLSVALVSAVIPLTFLIARAVIGQESPAVSVAAFVAAMPELMIDVSRVSNESIAIVLYSLLVYVSLKVVDNPTSPYHPWFLGLTLGLGLLTKAYFLAALPAVIFIFAWCIWRYPLGYKKVLLNAFVTGSLVAVISGWWYWRNQMLTGSWSGQDFDAALGHVPLLELLNKAPQVDWHSAIDSILVSHIWFGNWSFLQVRSWMYHFFIYVALLAALGLLILILRIWHSRGQGSPFVPHGRHLFVLIVFYGFFWMALAYHILITFVATSFSASTGWYMYCLVAAEVLLVTSGLWTFFRGRGRHAVLPALVICFAMLELYATHSLLLPYYTGLIAHKPNGALPTFYVSQFREIGLESLLERLQVNKPDFITSHVLISWWLCYLASTLSLVAISIYSSFFRNHPTSADQPSLQGTSTRVAL